MDVKLRLLTAILAAFFLIDAPNGVQARPIELSEEVLKSYLKDGVPQYDQVNLNHHKATTALSQFNDQYVLGIGAETTLSESDDPRESIWVKQQQIGVQQTLPYGVSGGLAYIYRYEKFSAFFGPEYGLKKFYLPSLALTFEMDLWKNLLGSLDSTKVRHIKAMIDKSKLNKKLELKKLHNHMRALYWRLVAQDRRIQIFKNLVATARRGYRNMKRREADSIADDGAVAEMAANLSSAEANFRKSTIDRNFLERDLKVLVPTLQTYTIRVRDNYVGVRRAVAESVNCSRAIGRMTSIPYDYTEYDELIRAVDDELRLKSEELDSYDDPDVKLSFVGRGFGLDEEWSEAAGQPFALEKSAYEAVLSVSVPLGLDDTEKQLVRNEKMNASILRVRLAAEFKASHSNLQKNFAPLAEAVDLYHKSIRDQEDAFKTTERKFRQGRISVFDYISSQNTLLNSKLQVLGLEERLILEMLTYYSIFNQAPCSFNRKS
ncbi:TolC family protein [Pseudobacteriovorax antillogorgiicola]|uniref:Outer membrane protein TolC n=1 Tax=Pseudobacteriovorax antillogorgiicola TaxID=1513793 RepID=A0A1Y6BV31_9BACT|nr:TolC family protein [Pseudobacteriovorax antillogorgiicola]TCS52424.1 outer membrane protein TolC [Pseudobacteriovorax antillogorgiicola]SMF28782.1 Outer membrane protein TolC [Pseudobacteriovorax antillogorgiicola]